jgi:hypothetical protein
VVESIFAGFAGGAGVAGESALAAAVSGTQRDVAGVKGVQESAPADGDPPSTAPAALATPFGDVDAPLDGPLSLLLLLAALVSAVFVTRGIIQALR